MYSIETISASTGVCLTGHYQHFSGRNVNEKNSIKESQDKIKAINPVRYKWQVDFAPLKHRMAERDPQVGGACAFYIIKQCLIERVTGVLSEHYALACEIFRVWHPNSGPSLPYLIASLNQACRCKYILCNYDVVLGRI